MVNVVLEPVDTWFFSDGTPSAAGGDVHGEVGGVFPPHPPTVVGALRAGLARTQGWRYGAWPPEIRQVLGDGHGEDSLGPLRFDGPYLVRGGQLLYPAPAHLVMRADGQLDLLRPAQVPRPCDLAGIRLPELPDGQLGRGLSEPTWLTATDLHAILLGNPNQETTLIPQRALWVDEPRVGIARDNQRRVAKEGALYLARHIRLHPTVGLGMQVSGLPPEWEQHLDNLLLSFGGEARMATCRRWEPPALVGAALDEILDQRRLTMVALTPLDANARCYLTERSIPELPGVTVVSACLPRSQRIGGWAETGVDRRGSLATRSVLAPGSVLFAEVTDPDRFRQAVVTAGGRPRLGQFTRWGFGTVALGTW